MAQELSRPRAYALWTFLVTLGAHPLLLSRYQVACVQRKLAQRVGQGEREAAERNDVATETGPGQQHGAYQQQRANSRGCDRKCGLGR